jgi:hypothetical protein
MWRGGTWLVSESPGRVSQIETIACSVIMARSSPDTRRREGAARVRDGRKCAAGRIGREARAPPPGTATRQPRELRGFPFFKLAPRCRMPYFASSASFWSELPHSSHVMGTSVPVDASWM